MQTMGRRIFWAWAALGLGCAGYAGAAVVHVSAMTGNDANDGSSWALAKQTIQAGVDAAASNDTVLVTNGSYNTGGRIPPGQVLCHTRVVIDKAVSVVSVNGPSNTFIVGQGPRDENAIRCVWMTNNATLGGFTLTNGFTVSLGGDDNGGGIYAVDNSATITNCIIVSCQAASGGGAYGGTLNNCTLSGNSVVYGDGGGGAHGSTLNNCTLSGNSAGMGNGGGAHGSTLNNCTLSGNLVDSGFGGGAHGSTLYNCTLSGNSSSQYAGGAYGGTLNNCTLSGNSADIGGGAMESTLYNCTLSGNSAYMGGGVSYCTLINCTISGNSAGWVGGGAFGGWLYNCTLSGNSASSGGGATDMENKININNCTVYGNTNGGVDSGDVRNTIIYGNTGYEMSNTEAAFCYTNDPLFVDAAAGDLRLQSNSPCIDAGWNAFAPTNVTPYDLDGQPRIINGRVDMGAYEYQVVAPSPTGYWGWAAAIANGLTNYSDCATGDGYPNLLKYATGSSPTVPDARAQLMEESSDGFFLLRFNRNTNATDVTLIVESAFAATNGAPWRGIASNIHGAWGGSPNVVESGTATPVTVTVREPVPATNRYMRLRVTRP
jgi:hypothetical protein